MLPSEDTSRPAIWKTARTVQACDRFAAEDAVDVDVPTVVVDVSVVVVVEVPPRSCVDIFTVLPPEDTGRPASWKNARMVQACDHQIAKQKVKRMILRKEVALVQVLKNKVVNEMVLME